MSSVRSKTGSPFGRYSPTATPFKTKTGAVSLCLAIAPGPKRLGTGFGSEFLQRIVMVMAQASRVAPTGRIAPGVIGLRHGGPSSCRESGPEDAAAACCCGGGKGVRGRGLAFPPASQPISAWREKTHRSSPERQNIFSAAGTLIDFESLRFEAGARLNGTINPSRDAS